MTRNLPRPTSVEKRAAEALTRYQWAADIAATLYDAGLLADMLTPEELAITFGGIEPTDLDKVLRRSTVAWNRAQHAVMRTARALIEGRATAGQLAEAFTAYDAAADELNANLERRYPDQRPRTCDPCECSWSDHHDPSPCFLCGIPRTGFGDLHAAVRRPDPEPLQPTRRTETTT